MRLVIIFSAPYPDAVYLEPQRLLCAAGLRLRLRRILRTDSRGGRWSDRSGRRTYQQEQSVHVQLVQQKHLVGRVAQPAGLHGGGFAHFIAARALHPLRREGLG